MIYSLKNTVFVFALAAFACNKKPSAEFSTDKPEYTSGETVRLTNESKNATSYRWTFPDGHTETKSSASYITSESTTEQSLAFKLEAFSKNGKKSDYSVKNVKVKAIEVPTGKIVLCTSKSALYGKSGILKVNGVEKEVIRFPNDFVLPTICDYPEFSNVTLPVGDYVITVQIGSITYGPQNIKITKGSCTACQIN